ncbi:YceI family protein [Streptomyces europaeiscabiei]|uniref:YceI family protein n=1 Tax=Streptomyces TaxID=1883 RepID=UPI000A3A6B26|nr:MULTISPECIES: YceI family protein [Streptomyces]MDX3585005.1 YceI family protein [Streptomyces europaeiscabiei]MDX3635147.1 YceI family protein [Streptomyces europaeiscabiei]MDX3650131.1 YceI family protein [Streptomyces europaeiscabiei]WUD37709.1 YceI family protein [Streptomyces europaeiscabiei]
MTVAVDTGLWQLDTTASTVALQHKTMWGLVTVKGAFDTVRGQGEVRPDGSAVGVVALDAASLDTKSAKRDEHLRSADFFDVEHHPEITFAVRSAELRDTDTVQIVGQLTVRGISRSRSLTAKLKEATPEALTLEAEFTVDREQFGIGWNQLGMMRGLATITATLRFVRAGA